MTHSQNPIREASDQFSELAGVLYANHAAMGPWPRATREAVAEFAVTNHERGPMDYASWLAVETRLRERVTRMLNAGDAQDIALLRNTTEGIGTVARGLEWRAGDRIVTARGEFITNRLAWAALEARGVVLDVVDLRAVDDPEAALAAAFTERTRLLTVSSVQWDDGFRLDLGRLGRACRDAGVLFFVDAIQQLGALQLDVRRDQVDFLAAGSHKWQLGPEGMGVLYVSPALRGELGIANPGWRMLDDPYRFDRPDREPSPSARRFEGGSPNTLGQIALEASLGVLDTAGMAAVESRVLANTAQLMAGIRSIKGIKLVSRTAEERRSGIVSLLDGDGEPARLHRNLKRQKLSVALRGDLVRFSPHFYQGAPEMDRLLNALEDAKK